MTKISIKELNGRECFSLSKDNVELFFEYDTTSFRMPMFLQLVFDWQINSQVPQLSDTYYTPDLSIMLNDTLDQRPSFALYIGADLSPT